MIPYPAPLEFFITFFSALPVPFRAFVLTIALITLGVNLFVAIVKWILG